MGRGGHRVHVVDLSRISNSCAIGFRCAASATAPPINSANCRAVASGSATGTAQRPVRGAIGWSSSGNRIAVRFQYESPDTAGQWWRGVGETAAWSSSATTATGPAR
ncbi:DUF1348 family protein [Streptomyces tubercidicus]|uniref:Uncharacterized protein n=1 Tax=Streptomyces tubercidicus TaxID=47759 RepID=A0A640UQQ1_9ACTN|nr:DUF1348 family protein [Streptomyces tubercidicus]WAU12853.1 nuclear transport factor 2 family protein [Streptomyces tubercidicus]GFE38363.1 hypothetical protein Stube_30360 [Streptomyces tubercidicus]